MAHHESQSFVYLRIRFFRNEGLVKWRVFELAAFLPLLLQLSLVLFFLGLSEYLRVLNPIVGWATSVVMITWLLIFAFTTLAPVFSEQCPYNTPLLKTPIRAIRHHLYLLPYRLLSSAIDISHLLVEQLHKAFSDTNNTFSARLYDWKSFLGDWEPKRDAFIPRGENHIRDEDMSDLAILVHTNSLFLDTHSKEMISGCAEELKLDSATTSLCACLVMAAQGFRSGTTGSISVRTWIPVRGLPPSSPEPLCRIFLSVIHGEINRLCGFDSRKDVLTSLITLHRSLTVVLSFRPLLQTKAFQQHFHSLLFRMIDHGEHTAVCALLALYSAGNLWLKDEPDEPHGLRLDRLKTILQDSEYSSNQFRKIRNSSCKSSLDTSRRVLY